MRPEPAVLAAALLMLATMAGAAVAGERQLLGDDVGRLRREALQIFPRGMPVRQVADELASLGFRCAPTRRVLATVSAPTIECDSAGRGYPTTARVEITLVARNGALADIAVATGLTPGQADARTPDGPPREGAAAAAPAEGEPRR